MSLTWHFRKKGTCSKVRCPNLVYSLLGNYMPTRPSWRLGIHIPECLLINMQPQITLLLKFLERQIQTLQQILLTLWLPTRIRTILLVGLSCGGQYNIVSLDPTSTPPRLSQLNHINIFEYWLRIAGWDAVRNMPVKLCVTEVTLEWDEVPHLYLPALDNPWGLSRIPAGNSPAFSVQATAFWLHSNSGSPVNEKSSVLSSRDVIRMHVFSELSEVKLGKEKKDWKWGFAQFARKPIETYAARSRGEGSIHWYVIQVMQRDIFQCILVSLPVQASCRVLS